MRERRTTRPQLVLEMTMRDVLGNMEEMVSGYGLHEMGGELEIIAIEPATQTTPFSRGSRAPLCSEIFSAQLHQLPSRQVA